jgi:hypothetical protein
VETTTASKSFGRSNAPEVVDFLACGNRVDAESSAFWSIAQHDDVLVRMRRGGAASRRDGEDR